MAAPQSTVASRRGRRSQSRSRQEPRRPPPPPHSRRGRRAHLRDRVHPAAVRPARPARRVLVQRLDRLLAAVERLHDEVVLGGAVADANLRDGAAQLGHRRQHRRAGERRPRHSRRLRDHPPALQAARRRRPCCSPRRSWCPGWSSASARSSSSTRSDVPLSWHTVVLMHIVVTFPLVTVLVSARLRASTAPRRRRRSTWARPSSR